jgi:lysophospholipase L1-like esterase
VAGDDIHVDPAPRTPDALRCTRSVMASSGRVAAFVVRWAAATVGSVLLAAGAVLVGTPLSTAAGESALTGPPVVWNMVGLGDSIPAASDCPGCAPFDDLYAERIVSSTGVPVQVTNLGVGGATSADLLNSLTGDDDTETAVRDADIITVTIGANDFAAALDDYEDGRCAGTECFTDQLPGLRSNLTAILATIHDLRAGRPTAVRVTGYWSVFVDGQVADDLYGPDFRADTAAVTLAANDTIREVALDAGDDYVDLYTPFKGAGDSDPTPLLTDDGDHPNQKGHELIADSLAALGTAPLALPAVRYER